jgi:hypothetical protein
VLFLLSSTFLFLVERHRKFSGRLFGVWSFGCTTVIILSHVVVVCIRSDDKLLNWLSLRWEIRSLIPIMLRFENIPGNIGYHVGVCGSSFYSKVSMFGKKVPWCGGYTRIS